MRIVADENVDMPVFEFLKKAGFNIEHISHLSRGSSILKDGLSQLFHSSQE
jgi:hypothetical protein